jgi:hypothetical protein
MTIKYKSPDGLVRIVSAWSDNEAAYVFVLQKHVRPTKHLWLANFNPSFYGWQNASDKTSDDKKVKRWVFYYAMEPVGDHEPSRHSDSISVVDGVHIKRPSEDWGND